MRDEPISLDRDSIIDTRRALQRQLALAPTAWSTDGVDFSYHAPIEADIPNGGYVLLATVSGNEYLGQIVSAELASRAGPTIDLSTPGPRDGPAAGSGHAWEVQLRYVRGTGRVLGRLADGGLTTDGPCESFDNADIASAPADLIQLHLSAPGGTQLHIGRVLLSHAPVQAIIQADGFARHTFMCGQSGSGKTFSLGILLEQLLLETTLPLVILDPNSDHVRMPETRSCTDYNLTCESRLSAADHHAVLDLYRSAVADLVVVGADLPLRLRFSELTGAEQATVLGLDPLASRDEFNRFQGIIDHMGGRPYSVNDLRAQAAQSLTEADRRVALRVDNLGIGQWEVWAPSRESASVQNLLEERHRALVVDLGCLPTGPQRSVTAVALLSHLWRNRHRRVPVLIVIDEAHHICPAEVGDQIQELATELVIRIAGEGRKYGLYLLLVSQRPQKVHQNVLSQCDNLVLMKTNSMVDLEALVAVFSSVPSCLVKLASNFRLGEALIAGGLSPSPLLAKMEGRLSHEGGADLRTAWAT